MRELPQIMILQTNSKIVGTHTFRKSGRYKQPDRALSSDQVIVKFQNQIQFS